MQARIGAGLDTPGVETPSHRGFMLADQITAYARGFASPEVARQVEFEVAARPEGSIARAVRRLAGRSIVEQMPPQPEPLEELDFSVRAIGILRQAGIHTVPALRDRLNAGLPIRGIGPRMEKEITSVLRELVDTPVNPE